MYSCHEWLVHESLSATKQRFLFFCQNEEGAVVVLTKEDVDAHIKETENSDEELDFEVIGKIADCFLTMDINPQQIEFYKPDSVNKQLIDRAVLAVVQYLAH